MRDLDVAALVPFGWSDRVMALFIDADPGAEPGRVVRVERSGCVVAGADGRERPARADPLPAVGDWVALDAGVVRAVLPRWSALTRLDPDGASVQVLAANLDLVLVTAPADRLSPSRVEREVTVGWESGARPVVVVTKGDLAPDGLDAELRDRLTGVEVILTSAATGAGVDAVRAELGGGRTAVLMGPSGAGKSTLANALVGADLLATGAVRESDARGRHTTTSRRLVPVPGGGVLIDTPGLRSLGLAGDGGLERAFPDVEALARECRFADCGHDSEPGCAVRAAVAEGALDPARLASHRKLEREAAAAARRADPVLRTAERRVWKARTKALRARYRERGG